MTNIKIPMMSTVASPDSFKMLPMTAPYFPVMGS